MKASIFDSTPFTVNVLLVNSNKLILFFGFKIPHYFAIFKDVSGLSPVTIRT